MSSFVEFKNVGKVYHMGEVDIEALKNVNFTIEKGELAVIVGPSGAGKTTTIRMILGILKKTVEKLHGMEKKYKEAR